MVTTLGSVVPLIKDYQYTLGQQELQIVYESFKVLPDDYDPGVNQVVAYFIQTEIAPEQEIDLSCSCLYLISNLTWINFDNQTNTFYVNAKDSFIVGDYKIVVV